AAFFKPKKAKIVEAATHISTESLKENGLRGDENERSWKIISWNVAGLRALAKKNAHKSILSEAPDLIFLGEIKCSEWPVDLESDFRKYHKTLAVSQEKKGGYAGVALLSKIKPIKLSDGHCSSKKVASDWGRAASNAFNICLSVGLPSVCLRHCHVWKGIGNPEMDRHGRLIVAEYSHFYFIGAYVINSGQGLVNLERRGKWEELFLEKIKELDEKKPIIYAGDLNVAHNEIGNLMNPQTKRNSAGFTDQERAWFSRLLDAGFKARTLIVNYMVISKNTPTGHIWVMLVLRILAGELIIMWSATEFSKE
ncbi:unnamed protein product, partial [Strongylus vulgaris]